MIEDTRHFKTQAQGCFFSLFILLTLFINCSTGKLLIQEVDDGAISTRIASLLLKDISINHFNIEVITDEGEVFLIGHVPNRATRRRAEKYARSIDGVWSVINYLRVGPETNPKQESDLILQTKLIKGISLLGEVPFVVLAVHVHDSEAYLIGRVKSEADRQALINTMYQQEGIVDVHEHLKLGSRLN